MQAQGPAEPGIPERAHASIIGHPEPV
jgi:hypothetical protein